MSELFGSTAEFVNLLLEVFISLSSCRYFLLDEFEEVLCCTADLVNLVLPERIPIHKDTAFETVFSHFSASVTKDYNTVTFGHFNLIPLVAIPPVDVISIFRCYSGSCTLRHRCREKVPLNVRDINVHHGPNLVAFLAFGSNEFCFVNPSVDFLELMVVVTNEVLYETDGEFRCRHCLNLGNSSLEVEEFL